MSSTWLKLKKTPTKRRSCMQEILWVERLENGRYERWGVADGLKEGDNAPLSFGYIIGMIKEAESLGNVVADVLEVNTKEFQVPATECLRADINNMRIWYRHLES